MQHCNMQYTRLRANSLLGFVLSHCIGFRHSLAAKLWLRGYEMPLKGKDQCKLNNDISFVRMISTLVDEAAPNTL